MAQRNTTSEILRGIGVLFLGHLALVVVSFILRYLLSIVPWQSVPLLSAVVSWAIPATWIAIALIGLSQLIYAVPLGIRFRRQRKFNAMKGVIIGAVITVLLNGGCFIWFLYALSVPYR